MLNALDRLADTYQGQIDTTRQDLAIAEGQLRDHQARLGRAFAHDAYLAELTGFTRPAQGRTVAGDARAAGTPPVAELAERIKSLKAAHTIDAAPERTAPRRIAAEEPVTARIRRRTESMPAIEPPAEPETSPATPVEILPVEAAPAVSHEEPTPQAVIHPFLELPSALPRPQPAYRQQVARSRRQNDRQMSLF